MSGENQHRRQPRGAEGVTWRGRGGVLSLAATSVPSQVPWPSPAWWSPCGEVVTWDLNLRTNTGALGSAQLASNTSNALLLTNFDRFVKGGGEGIAVSDPGPRHAGLFPRELDALGYPCSSVQGPAQLPGLNRTPSGRGWRWGQGPAGQSS